MGVKTKYVPNFGKVYFSKKISKQIETESVCTYVKFMSICHRNLWVQSLSFLALYFLSYGFVSSIYYNFSKFLHINLYFSIEITGLIWTRYLKATYAPERKWYSVTTHLKSWICLLATKEKLCYVS